MTDQLDDFIHGSKGAPSAFTKGDPIGTVVRGSVVKIDTGQVRDFETQQPAFWPDGNPKLQLIVSVQTDQRDPSIEDDDGVRRLFAPKPGAMLSAISTALRKADAKLDVGGTLAVKYDSDKPNERRGLNPQKQYVAQYVPPVGNADADDLLATGGDLVGSTSSTDVF